MEEIRGPEGGPWVKVEPASASASATTTKRLPGFTFRVWLAVIAAAAGLQVIRSTSGTRPGTVAAAGAIGLAVTVAAVVLRRKA